MNKIAEIKSRTDIVELAMALGLQPNSRDVIFSIYKEENNPSLQLYRETNSFYCFATKL